MRINAAGTGSVIVSVHFVEYFVCCGNNASVKSNNIYQRTSIVQGCDPHTSSVHLFGVLYSFFLAEQGLLLNLIAIIST